MFIKNNDTPAVQSTWLDRAITWVSPERGAKRAAWRTFEASYKGGVPTRTSEGWERAQGIQFGTSAERLQITDARSRAYQAYKNNPVASTLIDCETDNVIGDGLNYQPTSSSEDWNKEAQDRYYEWLDDASVRGGDIHSGCELTRLIWNRSRVGGDIGWILVGRVDRNGRPHSKIQIVQGERIETPDGQYGDASIVDGIRYDFFSRPISFFVRTQTDRGIRTFQEIEARNFVFLPHYTDADQGRGESALIKVFDNLNHIQRYTDGVAMAAWMATVFGIVFKQESASKQIEILDTVRNSAGNQQRAITLENGGMVKYVGQKDEVAQVQAHQPMQQTPDFIRALLRLAGMVFGMPLEAFARDMSTCNFASARIGLLPFYRSCKIKGQGTFGPRWSRTIGWWLSRERHRADDDPKKWRTEFPDDFLKHELLSNAWEYTDPVSEVEGDLIQVDAGFKSPQMVIAERGRDSEKILRERHEWATKTAGLQTVNSTKTRHPQTGVGATGDPLGHEQIEPPQPAPAPTKDNTNGNK